MIKKLLGLAVAFLALLLVPAAPGVAGDIQLQTAASRTVTGKTMQTGTAGSATADTFNFGFESKWMRVCLRPISGSATAPAFFRFGHTLVGGSNGPAVALADTSRSTIYVQGGDFVGTNSTQTTLAFPMYSRASSTDEAQCVTADFVARGITMFTSSGNATADVWAGR